jgi:hypothetical protein
MIETHRALALGTMPKFSENDVSDAQIGQILDYVDALRKHRRAE